MADLNHHLTISWRSKSVKRSAVLMLLGLVLLYGVIPNLHSLFGLELHLRLPKAPAYLIAAILSYYLTFIFSSLSYRFLAIKKLRLGQVWLVQLASAPLNLLLPAGIGGISINYLFLRTKQFSQTISGLVIAFNNALGIAGNVSLLLLWLLLFGVNSSLLHAYRQHESLIILVLLLVLLGLLILILFLNSAQVLARHVRQNLTKALKLYQHSSRWLRVIGAYSCAIAQAIVTALAFWLTLKAFRINLAYPITFLIYSLSVLVGGFFPTPGGLGGVEASLVAGIVAVHGSDTSLALSAVLGYRAISYWLPAFTGGFALFLVRRLRLIKWR